MRSSSAARTTGSRSKSDHGAALEEGVRTRVRRQVVTARRLEAVEERGEEERTREARIPPASWGPRGEPLALAPAPDTTLDLHGAADRGPAFRMCVEQEARPVRRGGGSRHEMSDGCRVRGDERLLLLRQRRIGYWVASTVDDDAQPPLLDPRSHLDRQVERRRPDLLEPEAVLLDEIEREPVPAWRTGRHHARSELDGVTRSHDVAERRADAVPHDRVSQRVEPVVRELNTLAGTRTPRRRPGILEPEPYSSHGACPHRLELVGDPANGQRSGRHEMLPDAVHFQG